MNKPIVFFGTEDFSALTLEELINKGFKIEAVVTKPDFKRGRGKKLEQPVVKKIAQANNILVLQPANTADLKEQLNPLNSTVAVLVSYGKIIPEHIINMFTHGIINLHPSLLPKYRGPAPIEAAILNGDITTGVTIMALDKGMDSGPIYATQTLDLTGTEDTPYLYSELGKIGAQLMAKTLPKIISGELTATAQDETQATYTKIINKMDGLLEPHLKTASELEQQIRAQITYPKSFIEFDGARLIIKKAHTSDNAKDLLSLECKDGRYLVIDQLLNKNGKLVTAIDYINSTRS